MISTILVVGLITLTGAFPQGQKETFLHEEPKCGYDSCPKSVAGKLNVHMVPHTHDDVGWLKTVDQYYLGSKTYIQHAGVQYILDSVINELYNNPKRKFIYVETAFFWKWWLEQDQEMKQKVLKLVKNGQLEFTGGAWSMNDEATTHYQSTIDQFTWGFRKLNSTFGTCGRPKIGWQIDPFGHSRETASLMAQFGFDGLFFARLDYQDKKKRLDTKTMELIWEADPNLGSSSDLFTGVLYNHYSAPEGFCFDILCQAGPIVTDKNSPEYNLNTKVDAFMRFVKYQAEHFKTNNIILTMGDDFNYQDAHRYFKNMDALIRGVNELKGNEVNVFYSTPSCYLKSLNDANLTWTTKQDDFFPYASDIQSFWTGYFTSRPTLKYFERQGNNYLQIGKQLSSQAALGPDVTVQLDDLREAMGIMQHHDAITGTEKQHVAEDYARILTKAIKKSEAVTNAGLNKLMTKGDTSIPQLSFQSCPLLNISECSTSTNSEKFITTIYNPLSRSVNFTVRLPVSGNSYSVKNPEDGDLETQIVPIPAPVLTIPGRTSKSKLELVFVAENIPPLGYKSYYISATKSTTGGPKAELFGNEENIEIGYDNTKFTINKTSALLSSLKIEGNKVEMSQALEYYLAEQYGGRASGAYIFRPSENDPRAITNKTTAVVYKGPIVSEVHQVFSNWASQVIRLYKGKPYLETEWLVGPIPIPEREGKEIISRFKTNLNTSEMFYTDSNGRQTIERKRFFRPTWDVHLEEYVSGNYYPITTDISINDKVKEVMVITDRAQGGSSIHDGQIELLLHRRLTKDDGFGVGEALNEEAFGKGLVARGRHWVIVGNKTDPNWRLEINNLRQEKVLSPQILLTDATKLDYDKWSKSYRVNFKGLTRVLPPEVHILTLEPWTEKTYLLRLEHLHEKKEAKPVLVNLNELFAGFDIVSMKETALGGDRWVNEVSKLKWQKVQKKGITEESENTNESGERLSSEILMNPKQIRTFICEIKPKKL